LEKYELAQRTAEQLGELDWVEETIAARRRCERRLGTAPGGG
jgi:hypothetical protein